MHYAPRAASPSAAGAIRDAGAFVAILLALRVLFLLGCLDPSQERVMTVLAEVQAAGAGSAAAVWTQGPERPLYDREELYCATAAEAMRMRLGLPLSSYRFMAYGGGSLLISLLAAPLYALCGPHYLVFKILPLLVTLLGGFFWFQVARLWLGARAARWFALLYLLAPPVLVRTALIAKGDHPEAMAILGVAAFLGSHAIFAREERARRRAAAACGLAAGLGVWVSYSVVPVAAGLALIALARTRIKPRRPWALFAAGLGVGLIPWVAWTLATPQAIEVYGHPLGAMQPIATVIGRARALIAGGFSAGFDLPGLFLRRVGALMWLAAVVVGWLWLLRNARRPAAALIAGGTAAGLAAFCLAAPDPSSRYLMPVYPLLLLSVAALASSAFEKRPPRWAAGVIVLIAVLGAASQAVSIADSRFPALRAPLRGTDWPLLGEVAGAKLTPERIAALPETVRPHFWVGFGRRVASALPRERWSEAAALAGESGERHVWEGIGVGWMERRTVQDAPRYMLTLPAGAREPLRVGLARYGEVLFAPLAFAIGRDGIEVFLTSFAEEDRSELRRSCDRALAVMETHGVPPGGSRAPRGGHGAPMSGTAASDCSADGWALYRGASAAGNLRFWSPPSDARPAHCARAALRGEPTPGFWEGVAQAYEAELLLRDPLWLVGETLGSSAPGRGATHGEDLPLGAGGTSPALDVEVQRLGARLDAGAAIALREAAARAAAQARRDPRVARRAAG